MIGDRALLLHSAFVPVVARDSLGLDFRCDDRRLTARVTIKIVLKRRRRRAYWINIDAMRDTTTSCRPAFAGWTVHWSGRCNAVAQADAGLAVCGEFRSGTAISNLLNLSDAARHDRRRG
jgi:hypothetical protein